MTNEPVTLTEAVQAEMTLWALCLYCGRAHLNDPACLRPRVKDGDDRLDAVASSFDCDGCRRSLVKLVPTPRTMVSFDRIMGKHGSY